MEERKIRVKKEQVGYGEEHYLGGKASYARVVDRFIGNHLVLCNNVVNVDNELLYNKECGFYDYDDLYEERLEELKEEYKEQLEKEEITMNELEDMATEDTDIYKPTLNDYIILNGLLEILKK